MGPCARAGDRGYAMAALLVALAVMSLLLSMAMPAWRTLVKREKEDELIFRGQQYARAIALYQRKYANAYPPTMDVLVKQKFLRRQYKDPMSKDGEFQILYQGAMRQRPGGGPDQTSGATRPGVATGGGGFSGGASGVGAGGTGIGSGSSFGRGQGGLSPGLGGQPAGPRGGIVGVASKSKDSSLRVYNGRTTYNEWQFVWSPSTLTPGGADDQDPTGHRGNMGPGGFGNRGGGFGRGSGGRGSGLSGPPGGMRPGGMSDDR